MLKAKIGPDLLTVLQLYSTFPQIQELPSFEMLRVTGQSWKQPNLSSPALSRGWAKFQSRKRKISETMLDSEQTEETEFLLSHKVHIFKQNTCFTHKGLLLIYLFLPSNKWAWMFVPCREPNTITISHPDSKDTAVPESWLSSTRKITCWAALWVSLAPAYVQVKSSEWHASFLQQDWTLF